LSAVLDDLLSALGLHPDQKAMVLFSFAVIWLKCSLHRIILPLR